VKSLVAVVLDLVPTSPGLAVAVTLLVKVLVVSGDAVPSRESVGGGEKPSHGCNSKSRSSLHGEIAKAKA